MVDVLCVVGAVWYILCLVYLVLVKHYDASYDSTMQILAKSTQAAWDSKDVVKAAVEWDAYDLWYDSRFGK